MIGRLCESSCELQVAEGWYRTTALEDLLGIDSEAIYEDRLYRTLNRVLPHKEAIEVHLVRRFGELFELDYDLLLYDVTSTYFEGIADPSIAKRGCSRDHRPDCVQVNIALVVTRESMPLGYEIFPGNTAAVTTVEEVFLTKWKLKSRADARAFLVQCVMPWHQDLPLQRANHWRTELDGFQERQGKGRKGVS